MKRLILPTIALTLLAANTGAQYKMQNQTAPDETLPVKIYLVKKPAALADKEKGNRKLVAVKRLVNPKEPLAEVLGKSIVGAYDSEEAEGLSSIIYGLSLDSASLKNGTARINFKSGTYFRRDDETFREFFVEAVEKTAQQFRSVKRVEICIDGISNFFRAENEPIQKCEPIKKGMK